MIADVSAFFRGNVALTVATACFPVSGFSFKSVEEPVSLENLSTSSMSRCWKSTLAQSDMRRFFELIIPFFVTPTSASEDKEGDDDDDAEKVSVAAAGPATTLVVDDKEKDDKVFVVAAGAATTLVVLFCLVEPADFSILYFKFCFFVAAMLIFFLVVCIFWLLLQVRVLVVLGVVGGSCDRELMTETGRPLSLVLSLTGSF